MLQIFDYISTIQPTISLASKHELSRNQERNQPIRRGNKHNIVRKLPSDYQLAKMSKLIFLVAIVVVGCLAVAQAKLDEDEEVRNAMRDSFSKGFQRFSGQSRDVKPKVEEVKRAPRRKPFSQYTAKLPTPLGGGKPRIMDQYNRHNFFPIPPSVIPFEHPKLPNGVLTQEAAATIYVPHAPLQYSEDKSYGM